ncbi:MAG: nucleotide sugar dehydrogenase, partial [Vicinamibacteria bacterium]|nr:nucleotide sugar dehydrogenase [Vicinamibacteria bacterium]
GLAELVQKGVDRGHLRVTEDGRAAALATDLSLISVGTPSAAAGLPDLRALLGVAEEIGSAIAQKSSPHTIVVRSTVLPGTTRQQVVPAVERASGKRCGEGFAVCHNPEFLREGSSIQDFYKPPYTVIGEALPNAAAACRQMYESIEAPLHICSLEIAEAIKYASNSFHGLKVAFANEIGVMCQALGVDGRAVMDLAARDTKLNSSAAYLRPGYAFGGSCLPKDIRAMVALVRQAGLALPLVESILPSNEGHIERAVQLVLGTGQRKVALLGLSFKQGTDDLRESPLVLLAERLLGKGIRLRIYDQEVSLARLLGTNKQFIEREIPHIAELLYPCLAEAAEGADVLVVGNGRKADEDTLAAAAQGRILIALDDVPARVASAAAKCLGLSW